MSDFLLNVTASLVACLVLALASGLVAYLSVRRGWEDVPDWLSQAFGASICIVVLVVASLVARPFWPPSPTDPVSSTEPPASDRDKPSPTPRTTVEDPLWSKLRDDLDRAGQAPSPTDDGRIRDVRAEMTAKGLAPATPEQDLMVGRAAAAADRLAESDGRLAAFHAAAEAWRDRAPCSTPRSPDDGTSLTDYDRARGGGDALERDVTALSDARRLLGWRRRGFTSATPTYLFASATRDFARSLAAGLGGRLDGHVHLVDWREAALCIDLAQAAEVPIPKADAERGAGIQVDVRLALHWLDGADIEVPRIALPPVMQVGGTDHIEDDTRETAREAALDRLRSQVMGLMDTNARR